MGQAACLAKDHLSCLPRGGCGISRRPTAEDYADYLAQFADTSPAEAQVLAERQTQMWNPGDDRAAPSFCSALTPLGQASEFANPSSTGPTGCSEVCREIFELPEPTDGTANPDPREGLTSIELGIGTAEGEVLPDDRPRPLPVPPQFAGLLYDWSAPSEYQVAMSTKEQERLQCCLRVFVRSLLTGVLLQLRLDAREAPDAPQGQNLDAMLSLSQDLSSLTVTVGGIQRSLALRSIRWIRPPEADASCEEPGPFTTWSPPAERERMVVVRAAGGRFVRFLLKHREQAAFMGTCLRLLVKATRTPLEANT